MVIQKAISQIVYVPMVTHFLQTKVEREMFENDSG
jgi:hypothetical protein